MLLRRSKPCCAGVEEHGIPGVVAMVAMPDSIVYKGAFGKRETEGRVPMTEDTIFRISR